jgi:energy-coupling factor transporter ATP-binding protein EcfA2
VTGDQSIVEILRMLGEYFYRREDVYRATERPMPVDPGDALQAHERLVILGAPGAGKSTLLRYLARNAAQDSDGPLPLLIRLRGYATALGKDQNLALREFALMALTWPDDTPDGWALKFANPQDYLDILQNFERLPSLDDRVQECLDRLGQLDPMQVIDFIEHRIGNAAERHARGDQYNAIPFELSHAFESIRSSPRYVDVLRRVRGWMLREDVWFRDEAPES